MRHDEITAAAFHESGHAVAITLAFRKARWLPRPAPTMPVRYVQIDTPGSGCCIGKNIYSPRTSRLDDDHFPLMTAQVGIHIAGGIAESLHHCGTRPHGKELWAFAEERCGVDGDLEHANDVLDDLWRLTGFRYYAHEFAEGVVAMLLDNWSAVSALAQALIQRRRLDGDEVEKIIDRSLIRRAS